MWLGSAAVALGVGAALTAGSGIAQADDTGAATTKIRTVLSAQTVTSSAATDLDTAAKPKSFVSDKQSVVRQQNPAVTGDNNNSGGGGLADSLLGLGGNDSGLPELGSGLPELGSGLPGLGSGLPGLGSGLPGPNIPFIELGGGGGGLISKIAHALGGGVF